MRTAPFGATVQRVLAIPHQHFRTTDRSRVKGSRFQRMGLGYL